MSDRVTHRPSACVELLDGGLWLPDFGLSVNTVRGAAPALFTCAQALKVHGRKKGILAPEHTWKAAFPSARVPKAPAPLSRDVRLGLMYVAWFAVPDEADNAHLRILGEETDCVVIAPGLKVDHESIFEMMTEGVSTIVIGPVEREDLALVSLHSLASNWPEAKFVLYGRKVEALRQNSQLPVLNRLEMLVQPEQDSLF